jgi:Leucine-rich repeat (LRR) protein
LGNNKLSEAPSVGRSMEELISLKSLDISNNGFTELPEGSFVNLRSLQLLNLAGNQISRVHTRSFTHLPGLRKVDLSENLLRNFPRLFFDTTPLLEELRWVEILAE